ncbi:MAG: PEFG-CTERM sorting domain-containing protein, partial [Candidatus Nitrosomaritimum yanchengensis]
MSLDIKFRDSTGSVKKHANYDITVSQNGRDVLSVMGAHEHEGTGMHSTAPLSSGDKVDIKVTVLGFGLPNDQANWTGPKGEILMFNVVPEFGTVAMMILAVAIISIIAVSAKSKLSIMPKL